MWGLIPHQASLAVHLPTQKPQALSLTMKTKTAAHFALILWLLFVLGASSALFLMFQAGERIVWWGGTYLDLTIQESNRGWRGLCIIRSCLPLAHQHGAEYPHPAVMSLKIEKMSEKNCLSSSLFDNNYSSSREHLPFIITPHLLAPSLAGPFF